ncbi:hypothetical protein HYV50_03700 [Candidatus Pacearchaeota archaeon]|nr:hypothetical protein [Candidatus Pacearchaeota archaeon]
MKLSIFVLKFLFIGALFIVTNENLYLKNPADREIFFNLFYSWFSQLSSHLTKITGFVTNSEWLPAPENYSVNLEG